MKKQIEKMFIADGHYSDEPEVFIQVNTDETVNLYNRFYQVEVKNLPIKGDGLGHFVEAASKRYYISNFIPNRELVNLQEDLEVTK